MGEAPRGREAESHRRLAVDLFNHTWDLLEAEDRSREDDERMVHAAHASRFHWGEVGEPLNLAVGEWLIARVYATLRRPEPALHHAKQSLEILEAHAITGFCRASAYEGLAKAHSVAGEKQKSEAYIERAKAESERITDEEEREVLFSQLAEIPEYRG
ncbi:MAG: hypothetical protein ACE5LS_04230 [Thermoplasmata archaeon]